MPQDNEAQQRRLANYQRICDNDGADPGRWQEVISSPTALMKEFVIIERHDESKVVFNACPAYRDEVAFMVGEGTLEIATVIEVYNLDTGDEVGTVTEERKFTFNW